MSTPLSPNPARIDWITLAVENLDRSCRFYQAMNFGPGHPVSEGVISFELGGGVTLAIAEVDAYSGFVGSGIDACRPGGVMLSRNTGSRESVREIIGRLEALGGQVTREMAETNWGTFSGWVLDPDGHPWEICFNPRLKETASSES